MSNQKSKVKSVNVGSLSLSYTKDGQPVIDPTTGKQEYIILLNKDTKLTINGEPLSGFSLRVESPHKGIEYSRSTGKISDQEAEEKKAEYEKGGKYAKTKYFVRAFVEA